MHVLYSEEAYGSGLSRSLQVPPSTPPPPLTLTHIYFILFRWVSFPGLLGPFEVLFFRDFFGGIWAEFEVYVPSALLVPQNPQNPPSS